MSDYGAIEKKEDLIDEEKSQENDSQEDAPEESFIVIEVDEENVDRPTLGPIGVKRKRNAQIEYNPFDWSRTLFSVEGRPHVVPAFYWVSGLGTILVILSGFGGIGLDSERECRAWCSRFALGAQPHQYMGFILFLLMAFRTQNGYKHYVIGQKAFYDIKVHLRQLCHILLNRIPREAMTEAQRARILAFLIVFPYALTADIRQERKYEENEFRGIISDEDVQRVRDAPSMPSYILESLGQMIELYGADVSEKIKNSFHKTLIALYKPYSECERINVNPMSYSYVAHVRLLLVTYLSTLPLALVEQMGFSTIPVFWVIAYALMSLEMLAVEVENPFGYQGSDLRLYQYNVLMKDSILESWKRWKNDLTKATELAKVEEKYNAFGEEPHEDEEKSPWFVYW